MPSRATIEAFAKAVESNDHVGAIERFYAADAQTRENLAPPTVGKEALIAKEKRALASAKSVTTTRLSPILMEGDTVVFHWRFEFTRGRRLGADDRRARAADLARRGIDRGAVFLRSAAAGACATAGGVNSGGVRDRQISRRARNSVAVMPAFKIADASHGYAIGGCASVTCMARISPRAITGYKSE